MVSQLSVFNFPFQSEISEILKPYSIVDKKRNPNQSFPLINLKDMVDDALPSASVV